MILLIIITLKKTEMRVTVESWYCGQKLQTNEKMKSENGRETK